jgi:hypothetical protein
MSSAGPGLPKLNDGVTTRRVSASDVPAVLSLLEASLGWQNDDLYTKFFSWKHERSPFGPSPAWVAVDSDGRLLGFRTFLPWEFPALGYRILTVGPTVEEGAAVFRLQRRGGAVEAAICDLLAPGDDRKLRRELCRRVLAVTGADYAIRVGRFGPGGRSPAAPGRGPVLMWLALGEPTLPALHDWDLSLGDVELF